MWTAFQLRWSQCCHLLHLLEFQHRQFVEAALEPEQPALQQGVLEEFAGHCHIAFHVAFLPRFNLHKIATKLTRQRRTDRSNSFPVILVDLSLLPTATGTIWIFGPRCSLPFLRLFTCTDRQVVANNLWLNTDWLGITWASCWHCHDKWSEGKAYWFRQILTS